MSNPSLEPEPSSNLAARTFDRASSASDVPQTSEEEHPQSEGAPVATLGQFGRYHLKYKIGETDLGAVYAAYDPILSRLIAIKTLRVDIAESRRPEFNALFLYEARAAAGLSHPNIVTVFDAGISNNQAYIAMELLAGKDLAQLRKEGWRPNHSQAALIVRRVADALAYAHSKGVIHCDVKPSNIFMLSRTQPRLLDFGISRLIQSKNQESPVHGAAGSPFYMAPEQILHRALDRRTDVFALGVVLYELLTDQKPFQGDTLEEITKSVLEKEPPDAQTLNPEIPKALADIASHAMNKDMAHRYRSARAFSRELRQWLDQQGKEFDVLESFSSPTTPSRVGWDRISMGALGVAALAGLAWWSWSWPVSSDPSAVAQLATATEPEASSPTAASIPHAASTAPLPTQAIAAEATSQAASAIQTGVPAAASDPPPSAADTASAASVVALDTRPSASTEQPSPPASERERAARKPRPPAAPAATAVPAATAARGVIRIAVSPWGQVEVNGNPAGTSPPLNELTLPIGQHQITIKNGDFPPYKSSINVTKDKPVLIKHQF